MSEQIETYKSASQDEYRPPEWLAACVDKNGFYDVRKYLSWTFGDEWATLDGVFTAQELRDLADFMDAHPK